MSFMSKPWFSKTREDDSIEIYRDGLPAFTMRRELSAGQRWELRRAGEDEVIDRDQYRNDLMEAIQCGKYDAK